MKDEDRQIPLTLAELRAVAVSGYCSELCGRLATHENGHSFQGFCDDCASKEAIRPGELDDAETIRAVQARIDGLSAQPAVERWVIRFQMPVSGTAYVKGAGVFTYNEADANTWATEADAREWAGRALSVGSYNVVRL